MKILHITETMAYGVLKYLQEVVSVTDEGDVKHYIVYSLRSETPIDLKSLFPETVQLIKTDLSIKQKYFKSMQSLFQQIKEIEPNVIHLHSTIAGFYGRIISLLFPKITVYYTPHGYSFLMTSKNKLIRAAYWLTELTLTQLKGTIVACSKSEYHHAKKLSLKRKVILLENCLRVSTNHKVKFLQSNKQIIGVGRLEQQKNPMLFIEIVSQLKKIDSSIKAVWIGDGSLRSECEKLNIELKSEIEFTGWLTNKETLNYLKDSRIFLQTSKWEGLPYSVLEAISLGLPIIASDIRSHKDIIGTNYLGYIAKNKDEFIDFCLLLLNDLELLNSISQKNSMKLNRNYVEFSGGISRIYSEKR